MHTSPVTRRFVTYYRVSTAKQGKSGLGIEAQRSDVERFLRPGDTVIAEFTEHESGKRNDRPVLAKALAHARAFGATVLIARLDRLSRSAAFLMNLQEQGVPFIAADMPEADETMVGIMAIMARAEGRKISRHTKAALAEKAKQLKAEGKRLGNPNGAAAIKHLGNAKAAQGARDKFTAWAIEKAPVLASIREAGHTTARSIARELNAQSVPTARGGNWTAEGVIRIMARLKSLPTATA